MCEGGRHTRERPFPAASLPPPQARNIMLKSAGSAGCGVTAKVADFGLSAKMEVTETHMSNAYQVGANFTARLGASWARDLAAWTEPRAPAGARAWFAASRAARLPPRIEPPPPPPAVLNPRTPRGVAVATAYAQGTMTHMAPGGRPAPAAAFVAAPVVAAPTTASPVLRRAPAGVGTIRLPRHQAPAPTQQLAAAAAGPARTLSALPNTDGHLPPRVPTHPAPCPPNCRRLHCGHHPEILVKVRRR